MRRVLVTATATFATVPPSACMTTRLSGAQQSVPLYDSTGERKSLVDLCHIAVRKTGPMDYSRYASPAGSDFLGESDAEQMDGDRAVPRTSGLIHPSKFGTELIRVHGSISAFSWRCSVESIVRLASPRNRRRS